VRVSRAEGRHALLRFAYTYSGPEPDQPPIDLSEGWTVDKVVSLSMRLWPYALTVILGITSLHWLHVIANELLVQRRIEQALSRSARVTATARQEVPEVSAGARLPERSNMPPPTVVEF